MIAASFRAMATLEGSLQLIDADFNLVDAVRHRADSSIHDVIREGDLRAQLEAELAASLTMIRRLPQRIDRIVGDLESGRWHGYLGGVLSLFAFVLGARLLVVGFVDRDPVGS